MGSTKYYDLMEKQLLLALSLLAFSSYDFVRPNEEPSIKVNTAANTDQGSTHESIALVKEDGKWKALKDRNGAVPQMNISRRTPGILFPGVAESGRF